METTVDLGFASPPSHPLRLTQPYFPSKVGGRPAWLNPLHLPSASSLTCPLCRDPFAFLLQVYAPIRSSSALFHRTLFLFLCPRQECLSRHSDDQPTVVCWRSQLGRVNAFYNAEPAPKLGKREAGPEEAMDEEWDGVHLCVVCGLKGGSVCSGCKAVWYCGRRCQKRDWKLGHRAECAEATASSAPPPPPSPARRVGRASTLFPSYELSIDTEYIPSHSSDPLTHERALLSSYHSRPPSDDSDDDDGLSALGRLHHRDPAFARFRRRIAHNPEQVMRYERGGEELWVGSDGRGGGPGTCGGCGGPRVFEMQVLPQLLWYLERQEGGVRRAGEDERMAAARAFRDGLDWGSLMVYTCERSCGDGQREYRQEYVHLQPHSGQIAQPQQQA